MKKYLKILFGIILITQMIYIIPNKSFAITSAGDYEITSYDIDMVVNEDNTFDITENITAYFYSAKHGIFRKLPLRNSITRTDGTTSNNRAKVSKISVSEEYTTSNENGYKIIKIGSSSKTYTGKHSYTIKYKYDIGNDPLKDADELYFNLIGNYWDANISNVKFKITMPKEFDKSLLGFSSGYRGSTDSLNVHYESEGNVIIGETLSPIKAGQGLTVRLTLPEGYFSSKRLTPEKYSFWIIVICLICLWIADNLWRKYGKDDKVIETVEFYPPNNCNSVELGFYYKGEVNDKDIVSLLIYLADKGYLKIQETGSNKFKIIKLKEYDGNNEIERMFFNGLFSQRQIGEYVNKEMLKNKFYLTVNRIKREINTRENKEKIFESISTKEKVIYTILAMIVLIFCLITIKPVYDYTIYDETILVALIFPIIGFSVMFGTLVSKAPKELKIFGILWGLPFGGGPWIMTILPALLNNKTYLVTYIIGVIIMGILLLFIKYMDKRTKYGTEILGKIRGFKKFLKTAEKEQLESLVQENPQYFYNILPYTYVLGISNLWIKQFEDIVIQEPTWYDSTTDFSMHSFNHFIDSTMRNASNAMTSQPSASGSGGYSGGSSYSSGGSSSGGGSSGGGSGGGGGGSW